MIKKLTKRLNKDLDIRREKNLYREVKLHHDYRYNLASNDYFRLRYHPKVISKAQEACELYGTGSGASPLLSGFLPCHKELLDEILRWKQKSSGILFNSGYAANQSILKYLPGKKDLVLADRLIHNSLAQGLKQCAARFLRYSHIDMIDLENLLQKNHKSYDSIFVITESVFSMDGDYPDLKKLVTLKKKFPFREGYIISSKLVNYAEKKGVRLDQLSIKEINKFVKKSKINIPKIFDVSNSMNSKTSFGGTAPKNVKRMIAKYKNQIK